MPQKEIALALASFLDSPAARALTAPRDDVRRVVEAFLAVAYDELGTEPQRLDGEELAVILEQRLPAHFRKADERAARAPEILAAYLEHLGETAVVTHAWELRRALDERAESFREAVRTGAFAGRAPVARGTPLVHRAEKLGRNDPCFCGSGRKFKKCHGQG